MIGDLFDSPWKIAIIAVVIIVLFGSRKLPMAARSLGQSMRILKKEVSSLHEDDDTPVSAPAAVTPVPTPIPVAVPAPDHQAQIDALAKQLADLQQQTVTVPSSADGAQAK
jgi:sec-independent protein translocase protein TatA